MSLIIGMKRAAFRTLPRTEYSIVVMTIPEALPQKVHGFLGLGMKGMMFWDYDGDDNQGTLRNALWNAVMQEDKDAQLHDFINNSDGYKTLVTSCDKIISTGQYMAGTLIEETTTYPNYEGYPVRLFTNIQPARTCKPAFRKKGKVYMLNPTAEKTCNLDCNCRMESKR